LLLKELLYEVQRRWITAKPEDARALLEKPLTEKNTLEAIERLFSQRLERVSGEALMLLRVLALTAGPTSLAVLAHTQDQVLDSLGDEPSEVSASETALTRLCAMRLAKRLPSGRRSLPSYRIANALIREQVLERMPRPELVQLCKALAEVVEGDSAHAHARKFEYLRLAGLTEEPEAHIEPALRDARKHLAFGRASELQRWRIEHTDPSSIEPSEWRARRSLLAEFEASTGRYEVAAKLLKEIAEELDAGLERTEALGNEAEAWFYAGNLPEAERALEEALLYYGERYGNSNRSDFFSGFRERLERLRLGSVAPLDKLEDKVLTGEAGSKLRIYTLMLRTKSLLNSTQAPRIQRRLEDLGRKHGDRRTCADAYLHRAQILLSLDRPSAFRQAPALLDAAEQVYEALEDQEHMTLVLVARADLATMLGDPQKATELYKEADRRWRSSSNHTRLARASLDAHRGMLAIELARRAPPRASQTRRPQARRRGRAPPRPPQRGAVPHRAGAIAPCQKDRLYPRALDHLRADAPSPRRRSPGGRHRAARGSLRATPRAGVLEVPYSRGDVASRARLGVVRAALERVGLRRVETQGVDAKAPGHHAQAREALHPTTNPGALASRTPQSKAGVASGEAEARAQDPG
jgi:tetratricopeptide (TPR) repeat protein